MMGTMNSASCQAVQVRVSQLTAMKKLANFSKLCGQWENSRWVFQFFSLFIHLEFGKFPTILKEKLRKETAKANFKIFNSRQPRTSNIKTDVCIPAIEEMGNLETWKGNFENDANWILCEKDKISDWIPGTKRYWISGSVYSFIKLLKIPNKISKVADLFKYF